MNACPRDLGPDARRRRLLELLVSKTIGWSDADAGASVDALDSVLSPAGVDQLCTFLGHPRLCPHDRPIPRGDCCGTFALGPAGNIDRVAALSEMKPGDHCEVMFIRPRTQLRLERLGAYGLVPGSRVLLHQKRPAFVIQIGETDLALDRDVAGDIFVRPIEE